MGANDPWMAAAVPEPKKAKLDEADEGDALLSLESALAASDKDLGSQIEEFSKASHDESFGGSAIAGKREFSYDDAWNVTNEDEQQHQDMILALEALEQPDEGNRYLHSNQRPFLIFGKKPQH